MQRFPKGIRVVGVQDGYDSARRGHKLQAGLSGIIGEAFREMVKDRTYSALESRAKAGRPTGGRAYGYRVGRVNNSEAIIVVEIFAAFGDGLTYRAIAAELNGRRIPALAHRGIAPNAASRVGWGRASARC
jgi:site-specific DNA recombinase